MGATATLRALAVATWRDGVRRPGFVVGAVGLGALLATLPHLGNPAAGIRDNAALATELGLSSLILIGAVVGAVLGTRLVSSDAPEGLVQEIAATATPIERVVLGRFLGSAGLAGTFASLTALVASIGWIGGPVPTAIVQPGYAVGAVAGVAAAITLAPALGAAYASVLPREFALIANLVHLAAARALPTTADGAWLPALLPDPTRGDLAREIAFGRPIAGTGVLLLTAAGILHASALLAFVCHRARRRRLF